MSRQWTVDSEIKLFSLICDYKPAGALKQQNLARILQHINEEVAEKFTHADLESKLDSLYNIANVDKIEDDQDGVLEDEDASTTKTRANEPSEAAVDAVPGKTRTRLQMAEKKGRRLARSSVARSLTSRSTAEPLSKANTPDLLDEYSSELSDVEGEEAVIAKLKSKEMKDDAEVKEPVSRPNSRRKSMRELARDAPKEVKDTREKKDTRASKDIKKKDVIEDTKALKELDGDSNSREESATPSADKTPELKPQPEQPEPPLTRKRTRANAKLEAPEELPKKKMARTPAKKPVKREATSEEPEAAKADTPETEEEPKKRRSVRTITRRSLRR
ncbi:hypothetical protein PUMCH_004473 [Australozyma saopauloensis]|uniref:Chromatin modification-related protein EAF7 n=1 Tax=Australozyma saopauloensis TaxID=291208 RepID=A0AAX4HEV1_9ASCO|nr:hypothetical protein PUMCH_004473 [[Candida] saopauloensis]